MPLSLHANINFIFEVVKLVVDIAVEVYTRNLLLRVYLKFRSEVVENDV